MVQIKQADEKEISRRSGIPEVAHLKSGGIVKILSWRKRLKLFRGEVSPRPNHPV
jgi:hypothetical protein